LSNTIINDPTKVSDNAESSQLSQLEFLVTGIGLGCSIYTPQKTSSNAKKRDAVLKSRPDNNRISCEVRGLGKLKVFKFNISDVIDIKKEKGLHALVPDEISENKCVNFVIKDKGEFTIVLDSEYLSDSTIMVFKKFMNKYSVKDSPITK
jgi:hypothetical protein